MDKKKISSCPTQAWGTGNGTRREVPFMSFLSITKKRNTMKPQRVLNKKNNDGLLITRGSTMGFNPLCYTSKHTLVFGGQLNTISPMEELI